MIVRDVKGEFVRSIEDCEGGDLVLFSLLQAPIYNRRIFTWGLAQVGEQEGTEVERLLRVSLQ